MAKWGVWCQVSGGVTGTRQGWLKAGGEPMLFNSKESAEHCASVEQAKPKGGKTTYRYIVRAWEIAAS